MCKIPRQNPLEQSIYTVKKGQEGEIGPVLGWVSGGVEKGKQRGQIWWMYFVYVYKNRSLKLF
jgi:hypothetical protein